MLERKRVKKSEIAAGQVKVRVTHVLVSNYDAYCFTGEIPVTYPRTPGRFAVGVIVEVGENCYGVEKGARVFLNDMRPCGKCYNCKSGKRDSCSSPLVAVRDFDGFMRDFVVCDYSDVTVLPDSVDDAHALCIEHVALAENIFNKLNLPLGSRVAIIGGGFLASVMTQIAFYHKLAPIIIDNNAQNIERLKSSGAFFSFAADDFLMQNIENATSGALCDAAIYTSCSKLPTKMPATVLARNKDLVLGGFCKTDFALDTAPMFEKNLRVYTVSEGFGYTELAINMIMHGALNLGNIEKEILKDFKLAPILEKREKESSFTAKMTILKLIM